MTDTQPDVTAAAVEYAAPQYCKGCGEYIGELVERGGKTKLKVGNLIIGVARDAACAKCGRSYPFMASDKTIAQILERHTEG